ncbi:MAG: universal stress protein [Algoriphagus sp.]|uniref:universal stress protein n=1 Tax=Algoriphagus sp. TaxID=1872435 RepID=UPI0018450A1E|nr:universal stress protein [Algoriphagus sp.]NVJ85584.1 universal stress protein [Algoriphagus sp.]
MRILIPLDFSNNSKKALEYALGLFQDTQNSFVLSHVIEMVYDFASQTAIAIDGMHSSAKKHLAELVRSYESPHATFETEILEGTPSIQLARLALEKKVDLIIMGTHGISGLKKVLVGSTAVNVLKESSTPVMLVPEEASLSSVRKITLGIELANHEEQMIEKVATWSKLWDMDLQLIHVSKSDSFVEKLSMLGLEKYLQEKLGYLPKIHSQTSSDVIQGLQEFLKKHPDTMLAMCHSQRSLWDQFFAKGKSFEMAYQTHNPLLVML